VTRNDVSKILFDNISMVEPYPDNVAPVTDNVKRTAFFPGGLGVWNNSQHDKIPKILVLGQDFSTLKEYEKILSENSDDLSSPTWKNLINLFNQVGINLEDCFFSNAFMGLRKTESMTGKFPGYKDKNFVARNLNFLTFQIETIKPKVIITLGKFAADMLFNLAPNYLKAWDKYSALRLPDVGFITDVTFGEIKCDCVALEHPSMRNSNVKRRQYGGYVGSNAEVIILKKALENMNNKKRE